MDSWIPMSVFPIEDDNNTTTDTNTSFIMTKATLRTVTTREIFLLLFYSVLGCLVSSGNLLTIIAVYRSEQLRTTPNMYIVSLACADLLTGLTFPFYMASSIPSLVHVLNQNLINCALRYGLLYMFLSESFLCILAIAVDRYVYIMHPLKYCIYLSKTRTRILILLTWVISITIGLCTFHTSSWPGHCSFFLVVSRSFQLYFMVPYMIVIFALIAVLYGCITRQAVLHRRRILATNSPSVFRHKTTLRSVRLFLTIYVMFAACWLPGGTVVVVGYTVGVSELATSISLTLGLFHSGMNFVVYACMNKDFRKAFWKIFFRVCMFCRTCY